MSKDYDALKNVERMVIDHLHVKLSYGKQFTLQNCKRLPPGEPIFNNQTRGPLGRRV